MTNRIIKTVCCTLLAALLLPLCACARKPSYHLIETETSPSASAAESSAGISETPTLTEAPTETTGRPSTKEPSTETPEDYGMIALYIGVQDYGAEKTGKEHKNDLRFRFFADGREELYAIDNGETGDGVYTYRLQNLLREGELFSIEAEDGVITDLKKPGGLPSGKIAAGADGSLSLDGRTIDENAAVYAVATPVGGAQVTATEATDGAYAIYAPGEKPALYLVKEPQISPVPPVSGTPGLRTLKNLLQTALAPVGSTLYMYGGGWDWQDAGASAETASIGVSPEWYAFFASQDARYNYKNDGDPAHSYYPHGGVNYYHYDGLDCSGFVGWTLYNTLESESGKPGYVVSSTTMAKKLADAGYGVYQKDIKALRPGSIVSIRGHVWLCLGLCGDGSAVLVHSTPSVSKSGAPGGGVQIASVGPKKNCQAYALAQKYMTKYYPDWSARYDAQQVDADRYLTFESDNDSGVFNFSTDKNGLLDPDGYLGMSAADVLADLFGE